MTTAVNNARQVSVLLIEFDQDFGHFPNDESAYADADLKSYRGDFSNDYLGQLIAGGYVRSEEIFYAEGGSRTNKKPDNDIATQGDILEAGECGFAYLKNHGLDSEASTPILLTPMTRNGTQFDADRHDGKAMILRMDGSVMQMQIDPETGEALVPEGGTLFQGGEGTPWEVRAFVSEDLLFPK